MNSSNNVLELINVSKSFEHPVLKNISFNIRRKEFISIVGQSGVGKSTLFDIICNLTSYQGTVVSTEKIGYVNQKDLLLPWMTIEENITFFQKLAPDSFPITEPILKIFNLKNLLKKYPSQLSGGEKQRANLYRNYISNKTLWLLDEPFASLDFLTKEKMYNWLKEITKILNVTVLFITHDLNEAIFLSDKIFIFKGNPAQIEKIFIKPFNFPEIKRILIKNNY